MNSTILTIGSTGIAICMAIIILNGVHIILWKEKGLNLKMFTGSLFVSSLIFIILGFLK